MQKYQFTDAEQSMMENSRIPFAVYQFIDKRVVTLAVSKGVCDMMGFADTAEAVDIFDHDMYRDTHPDDVSRIENAAFRFATQNEPYNVVYRSKKPGTQDYEIIHAIGEHIVPEPGVRLAVVWYVNEGEYTETGGEYPAALNEVLSRTLHEESIFKENYYDYLTGLPNMTYFFALAEAGREKLRTQEEQTAIVFFDLSGMKSFNRRFGFAEGNTLIRAVAKLLVKHFSNENCARFGQDHFAVYTKSADLEKRLRVIFEENKTVNGGKNLPIRAGIYLDHFDQVDISTACDRAKMACDLSRKTYVSVYEYFDENLLNRSVNTSYILENLDRALEEKWVKVFYQPIIRMNNGKVCDEEALARWIDPVRGFLSPAEFIPILEDARLIYKLDLYMVDQILENMKQKERNGLLVVPVSVNLSRSDFDVCDIAEEIRRRVDAAGMERHMINIEITESVIGRDYDYMKIQVERFQAMGFRVWMDDFGTGYSAMDVLQNFDFDLIKFDMAFIQQFYSSKKSQIILTELMHMVVKLGIDTVAEGVETEDHIRFLREIGCDKIQGFFYSKPLPLDVILEWYRREFAIELENLQESDYYTTIGTIDLNETSDFGGASTDGLSRYITRLPMGIVELQNEELTLIRCNKAFEDYLNRCYGIPLPVEDFRNVELPALTGRRYAELLPVCEETADWVKVTEKLGNGGTSQSFIRLVKTNPVTGAVALLVVVLAFPQD